jgi:hypothetical protein
MRERFNTSSHIPDGFFYFPTELGGLELRNPFVPLFAVRDALPARPEDGIKRAREEDDRAYEEARKAFKSGEGETVADAFRHSRAAPPVRGSGRGRGRGRGGTRGGPATYGHRDAELTDMSRGDDVDVDNGDDHDDGEAALSDGVEFMSRKEYGRFSEQTSVPLRNAFEELLREPFPNNLIETPPVIAAFAKLSKYDVGGGKLTSGFATQWGSLDIYWQWVFDLYTREMVAKFGGLGIGERAHLPIGLVDTLKSERTRWLG